MSQYAAADTLSAPARWYISAGGETQQILFGLAQGEHRTTIPILVQEGKPMIKKLILTALGLLLVLAAACAPVPAPTTKHVEMLDNEFADGVQSYDHTLHLPDGDVTITTSYSTTYNTKEWHVTTPKTLDIRVLVKNRPENKTIYIENMHADVSLICSKEGLDGWKTDVMDDHLHTGTYPGFLIGTNGYMYYETFAIEGFSKEILEGWTYYTGTWGSGTIETKPLTETALIETVGVTGQKLTFVFDILIMVDGDSAPHKDTITDEFGIPVTNAGLNPTPIPETATAVP
jgi:hypothetical protein